MVGARLDKPMRHSYIEPSANCRVLFDEWPHLPWGELPAQPIHTSSWLIERAPDGESALRENVGIDHCCPDVAVTQEFLDRADIIAHFQQSGCERVPERMAASVLCDPRAQDSGFHCTLEHAFVDMMAAFFVRAGVGGAS